MTDTSGFYKVDPDSGEILFGAKFVLNAKYELFRDSHEKYTYPVGGWTWYDSIEEAHAAGIPPDPSPELDLSESTKEIGRLNDVIAALKGLVAPELADQVDVILGDAKA